jgi:hypothetical protein
VAGALSVAGLAAISFMKRKQKPDKLIGIEFKGPRGEKTISRQIRMLALFLSRKKPTKKKEGEK